MELHEIEVPTVEQSVREDALEIQDIRELGLGWAWFVNDLCAFLRAWQDMELASPCPDEPVTQIDADVPIEPISFHPLPLLSMCLTGRKPCPCARDHCLSLANGFALI